MVQEGIEPGGGREAPRKSSMTRRRLMRGVRVANLTTMGGVADPHLHRPLGISGTHGERCVWAASFRPSDHLVCDFVESYFSF